MKNLKLFITLVAVSFSISLVNAQQNMKNPITYQLKNGITLVVAENVGFGKIYASLSTEKQVDEPDNQAAAELDGLLNNMAKTALKKEFSAIISSNRPSVTFSNANANIASDALNFEKAFSIMVESLQKVALENEAIKTFYNKQIEPSRFVITIAGDIKPSQAMALTAKLLNNFESNNFIAAE